MAKTYKMLIREKKQLFKDFFIPWDKEIEHKFATEMETYPNADPECTLDRIVRPYIHKRLEWKPWDAEKQKGG